MTPTKLQRPFAAVLLVLWAVVPSTHAQPPAVATVTADAAAADAAAAARAYRLQPGDVVEISVWKEEDLSRQVLVRSDGGVSFPLVGDLVVAGLTPPEAQVEIEKRLTRFMPEPTVTVSVTQINGNQVFILGKVNRPGPYKFDRPLDVLQALSLAGGTTEFAGVDDIRIIRRGASGEQRVFEFEYTDVSRGRRLEQNILLQSGDTLVVP